MGHPASTQSSGALSSIAGQDAYIVVEPGGPTKANGGFGLGLHVGKWHGGQ